jgi:hypothetical protein
VTDWANFRIVREVSRRGPRLMDAYETVRTGHAESIAGCYRTCGVTTARDARRMDDNCITLQVGSHVLCPHCHRWHPVTLGHTEGTPYTQAMLYFVCRRRRYYAGQLGQPSRHRTRVECVDALKRA